MQSKDFYTRPEAAAYLTDKGLPTTKGSLQKQATVGGGPEYEIWGNKAVYRPSKLDAYAAQKLKPSRRSTSEVCAALTPGEDAFTRLTQEIAAAPSIKKARERISAAALAGNLRALSDVQLEALRDAIEEKGGAG